MFASKAHGISNFIYLQIIFHVMPFQLTAFLAPMSATGPVRTKTCFHKKGMMTLGSWIWRRPDSLDLSVCLCMKQYLQENLTLQTWFVQNVFMF